MHDNNLPKEFRFHANDVVLAKFGKEVYYAKILTMDRLKKTAMLLFDDESKEEHPFTNIFSVHETTSEIICVVCKEDSTDNDNEIVLCDECSVGFHQKCHKPKINSEVLSPDIPWQCTFCERKRDNPFIQSNPFTDQNAIKEMVDWEESNAVENGKCATNAPPIEVKIEEEEEQEEGEEEEEKESLKDEESNEEANGINHVYTSPFKDVANQRRPSRLDEIFKDRIQPCTHHDMLNNNSSCDLVYKHCQHSDIIKSPVQSNLVDTYQEKGLKTNWLIQQLKRSNQTENPDKISDDDRVIDVGTMNDTSPKPDTVNGEGETKESVKSEEASVFKPKILINNDLENETFCKSDESSKYNHSSLGVYQSPGEFDFKLHQEKYSEMHRGKSSIAPLCFPAYESLTRSPEDKKMPAGKMTRHGSLPNIHEPSPPSRRLSPKEVNDPYMEKSMMLNPVNKSLLSNPQLLNQSVSQLLSSPDPTKPVIHPSSPLQNHVFQQNAIEQRLAMYDNEIAKLKSQQQMLLVPQNGLLQNTLAKSRAMLEMENQLRLAEAVRVKELLSLRAQNAQIAVNPLLQQALQMENMVVAANKLTTQLNEMSSARLAGMNPPVPRGFVRNNQVVFNNSPQPMNNMRARGLTSNNHLTEREINALAIAEMHQKNRRNRLPTSTPIPTNLMNKIKEPLENRTRESYSPLISNVDILRNERMLKRNFQEDEELIPNKKRSPFQNGTSRERSSYSPPKSFAKSNSSPDESLKQRRHLCKLCKEESQFICSACRKAWYCSQRCQLDDWRSHSKICKSSSQR